jgi:hypothetical protein
MNKKHLPFKTILKSEYEDFQKLFIVEGGAYFFASKNDKYYVIADFGTMADFFEDERERAKLKSEYEFNSKDECREFINKLFSDSKNDKRNTIIPEALLQ